MCKNLDQDVNSPAGSRQFDNWDGGTHVVGNTFLSAFCGILVTHDHCLYLRTGTRLVTYSAYLLAGMAVVVNFVLFWITIKCFDWGHNKSGERQEQEKEEEDDNLFFYE